MLLLAIGGTGTGYEYFRQPSSILGASLCATITIVFVISWLRETRS